MAARQSVLEFLLRFSQRSAGTVSPKDSAAGGLRVRCSHTTSELVWAVARDLSMELMEDLLCGSWLPPERAMGEAAADCDTLLP